jgi:hypothetical protein
MDLSRFLIKTSQSHTLVVGPCGVEPPSQFLARRS